VKCVFVHLISINQRMVAAVLVLNNGSEVGKLITKLSLWQANTTHTIGRLHKNPFLEIFIDNCL